MEGLKNLMKTYTIAGLTITSIVFSLMLFSTSNSFAEPPSKNFVASMDGNQLVPPVDTNAHGLAKFQLNDEGQLEYQILTSNIPDFTSAKIQLAPEGINGAVVVNLFENAPSHVSGLVGQGTITDGDVSNGDVDTVAELIDEMESGNAYIVIRTESHPAGIIRGQI